MLGIILLVKASDRQDNIASSQPGIVPRSLFPNARVSPCHDDGFIHVGVAGVEQPSQKVFQKPIYCDE
jgi:hypothetical protein